MIYSQWFESLWSKYGAEEQISNAQKGSKRKAQESWSKCLKEWIADGEGVDEQEFAQAVWRGYESQRVNRRALRGAGKFCPPLTMVTTYLNQWRFEQEQDIPTSELKRMAILDRKCSVIGCKDEPIGRDFNAGWICRKHELDEWAARNREAFKQHIARFPRLHGETWRDWSLRDLERTELGRAVLKRFNARAKHSTTEAQP